MQVGDSEFTSLETENRKQGIRTASSYLMVHSVQRNAWSPLAFSPGNFISKMVQVSSVYSNTAQLSLSVMQLVISSCVDYICTESLSVHITDSLGAETPMAVWYSLSLQSSLGCFVYLTKPGIEERREQDIPPLNIRNFTPFAWFQIRLESMRRKMVSVIISRVSSVWEVCLGLSLPVSPLVLSVHRHKN